MLSATIVSMQFAQRHKWSQTFRDECLANDFTWQELPASSDGVGLTGLYIGRAKPLRSRTVVFLHGFGNDALFPNIGLFRTLLKEDWSLFTCDIRGHGQLLDGEFNPEDFFHVATDIMNVLDQLAPGQEKVHLIGYSIGAGILLKYANENTSRIATLTMIAMPLLLPMKLPFLTEFSCFMRKTFLNAVSYYGPFGVLPAVGRFKRKQYPLRLGKDYKASYVTAARSGIAKLELTRHLADVSVPSLFVGGSMDFIAPPDPIVQAAKLNPNLTISVLSNETHLTTLLSPETWAIVTEFLRNRHNA